MKHVLSGVTVTLLLFLLMQWMVEPEKPIQSGYQTVSLIAPRISQQPAGTASKSNASESSIHKIRDNLPKPGFTPALNAISSLQSGVSGSLFAPPDADSLLNTPEQPGIAGSSPGGSPTLNPDALPLASLNPDYPRHAINRDQSGWVKVRFMVTEQGTVDDIEIVEANPKGVFEQTALRAVREYRFRPRMVNGKPVTQRAERTIKFQLQ